MLLCLHKFRDPCSFKKFLLRKLKTPWMMSNCTTYNLENMCPFTFTWSLFSQRFTSHEFEPLIIPRKFHLIIKSQSSQASLGISHRRILLFLLLFKSALTTLNEHIGKLAKLQVIIELMLVYHKLACPQVTCIKFNVNVVII